MAAHLLRDTMVERLRTRERPWDMLIIGGGATGLGTAVDAAARGYDVALVEQSDFAKGTSSRSTKLVHGGVRYLQQGNVSLVLDALRERGLLRQNAPHLVRDLPFVVPNYEWWEAPFYGIGLKLYDLLAGRHGFGRSRNLSVEETLERLPTLERDGLRGGVLYHDGQFDDARLAIALMRTAIDRGATVANYVRVEALHKQDGEVRGARLRELEGDLTLDVGARVVINATGAFLDGVRRMDEPGAAAMIRPSQGVHLVLPQRFLGGSSAIMVPHTDDGRVLFAIPWHHRVVIGTTDTPIDEAQLEPRALPEEIDFLLTHAARYLTEDPRPQDVLSVFAGVRPLVGSLDDRESKAISRDHTLHISGSGLVSIAGGKWTTYRKMAEDTVDQAAVVAGLDERPCATRELPLRGWCAAPAVGPFSSYGADAQQVAAAAAASEPVLAGAELTAGEVGWAVEHEMARRVEDVLARRTRWLVLDARQAAALAPGVAAAMARALHRDQAWIEAEVEQLRALARAYRLSV